jgi:organic radical activating enzyme
VLEGQELKLVFPQLGADPQEFADLAFEHFYLQPMDGPNAAANTAKAISFCQNHPHWNLSIQTHKLIGMR